MPSRPPRERVGRGALATCLGAGLLACLGGGLLASTPGCWEASIGVPPDPAGLHFPVGVALDPRAGDYSSGDNCPDANTAAERPRWLFVTNANSDLVRNASSLVAIDLEKFFCAWRDTTTGVAMTSTPDESHEPTPESPCRRRAQRPQVVECLASPFIDGDATVTFNSFASIPAVHDPVKDDGTARVFVPVRGDPSIVYMDVSGGTNGSGLTFECGADPETRKCSNEYRLQYLFDDARLNRIALEPVNVFVADDVAAVTHLRLPDVTLIDLDGGPGGKPWISDTNPLLSRFESLQGYGLAQWPCALPEEPVAPDAENETVPEATVEDGVGCARPLIYVGSRDRQIAATFTPQQLDPVGDQFCADPTSLPSETDSGGSSTSDGDSDGEDGIGDDGAIICEPRIVLETAFTTGGFDIGDSLSAVAGDMAFSADGKSLYIVQTNPGALLRVDTSLDDEGRPRNLASGAVEVCAEPNGMVLFNDSVDEDGDGIIDVGTGEYAAVTCHRSALVFIVELRSFRVVANVLAGTGAHELVHDEARGYLYVANSLEATISVIDVSAKRPTRFTEVARIGLEEPYSR